MISEAEGEIHHRLIGSKGLQKSLCLSSCRAEPAKPTILHDRYFSDLVSKVSKVGGKAAYFLAARYTHLSFLVVLPPAITALQSAPGRKREHHSSLWPRTADTVRTAPTPLTLFLEHSSLCVARLHQAKPLTTSYFLSNRSQ